MATTQTGRRELPASARRLRHPARERAAGSRAVYDQDTDLTGRRVGRVATPDPVRAQRTATPDPVHMRRPATPDPFHARRPATPDPVHVRRPPAPDPVRAHRPAHDVVARWLALSSLALVTLIAALIILT